MSLACVSIHPIRKRFILSFSLAELNQLTGIAAILTFPLDVEVVEAEERAAKEEEEQRKLALAADRESTAETASTNA